jgi:5'-3' exoribonuclease 2
MGVPRLVKIILEKYSKSHQHVQDQPMHYFFMDFNPIIYSCFRDFVTKNQVKIAMMGQATIEAGIIEEVLEKTRHMICDLIRPQKLVYIAIDGPAPRGKMIQQRHRRYRKILEKRLLSELKIKYGCFEEDVWDTSNITPGTKFMEKLFLAIKKAIKSGLFSSHAKIDVILNDSNIPGEGEHKFLSYIRDLEATPEEKICIFSNDGDLLVLANRFAGNKDVYILTEPNQTSPVVQKLYAEAEFMYILMKEFQTGFIEELKLQSYDKNRIIYDYIFFTFFGGNDFVKPFPYTMMKEYNTFNLLSIIYKMLLQQHGGTHLISFSQEQGRPRVNTAFFKDFIAELAKREEAGMIQKQKRYNNSTPTKFGGDDDADKTASWAGEYSKLQNNYYYKEDHPQYAEYAPMFKKINYEQPAWKERYYQHFFGIETVNSYEFKYHVRIICLQYVKSLMYTLYYYLDEIPSWTWFYPYRVAPFPSDVQSALHNIDDINSIFKFEKDEPFKPFDQLMLVLPPQNDILPKTYRALMKSEELKGYYPEVFELDILAGEKFIYSEPLLPDINVAQVLSLTAKLEKDLTPLEKSRNTVKTEISS